MPTLADQTTAIKSQLGNDPLATTTLIERIYNEEYKALAKAFFFDTLGFAEDVDTVDGTPTAALVTNTTWFEITSILDTTTPAVLQEMTESWYDALEEPLTEGVPEYFVIRLGAIYLYPVPDGVYELTIKGRKYPATLTSAQTPTFPEEWHMVIEQQTVYRIAVMLNLNNIMMMSKNASLNRISEITENRTLRRRHEVGQAIVERRGMTY